LSLKILSFSPTHYPAFTALWNAAYPDLTRTEWELRLADLSATAPPARLLAELENRIVGIAGYEHLPEEQFHPRKFQLHLFVDAAFRNRGIGSQLYQQVISELSLKDALLVRVWVREDRKDSLRFIAARTFVEEMRTFHSALDVTTFDTTRLVKYGERLRKNGYRLVSFDDLQNDAERNRKVYSLYCEVMREIPAAEPPLLPKFEEYEQRISATPEYFRAHFIATRRDDYVGMCILLPKGRKRRELYADTLGVKTAFRGRGIAQALACCGIDYAKSHGYTLISADNFSENVGIIPLLNTLGFADRTSWILFSKALANE
jgi:GNAT superfamily N-acetyltransferase